MTIPEAMTTCALCGVRIRPTENYGRQVSAWSVPGARGRQRKDIDLQQVGPLACQSCMEKIKRGVNPGQGEMLA